MGHSSTLEPRSPRPNSDPTIIEPWETCSTGTLLNIVHKSVVMMLWINAHWELGRPSDLKCDMSFTDFCVELVTLFFIVRNSRRQDLHRGSGCGLVFWRFSWSQSPSLCFLSICFTEHPSPHGVLFHHGPEMMEIADHILFQRQKTGRPMARSLLPLIISHLVNLCPHWAELYLTRKELLTSEGETSEFKGISPPSTSPTPTGPRDLSLQIARDPLKGPQFVLSHYLKLPYHILYLSTKKT